MQAMNTEQMARREQLVGKAALIASVGGTRGYADWANPDHRLRRLLAEFIAMAGLTFVLSGGAAILARYGGPRPAALADRAGAVAGLGAVAGGGGLLPGRHLGPRQPGHHLGLRAAPGHGLGDGGLVLDRAVRGGHLRVPAGPRVLRAGWAPGRHHAQPGQSWQAAGFEAIITFGLVLMILNLANGPKLNGPFVPLAVGAYIMAWGTMGGPFEGAPMNPARSLGPDVAVDNAQTAPGYGGCDRRGHRGGRRVRTAGPAKVEEANAAEGQPLHRVT
jgi:glycerol uptake facilitator-like aquaporin